MHAESVIDVPAFIDRVAFDPVLARRVIDLFIAKAPKLLVDIEQAIYAHDNTSLAGAAHSLKGSIGNFCTGRAYELALKLEKMAFNIDLTSALETLSLLRDQTALLVSELEDPQSMAALERAMRSQ